MTRRLEALVLAVAVTIAAVTAAWAAAPKKKGASAGSKPCLSKPCKDKKKRQPKGCCDPPPCRYHQHLEDKLAQHQMFNDSRLRERYYEEENSGVGARRSVPEKRQRAGERLKDHVREASATGRLPSRSCPDGDSNAPGFETEPNPTPAGKRKKGERPCVVMQDGKPVTRGDAHRNNATCSEFIDAAFEHEEVHMFRCEQYGPDRGSGWDQVNEEVLGYATEVRGLYGRLLAWAEQCTGAASAEEMQQVVDTIDRARRALRD